jgi:acyl carrier protein
MDKSEIKNKVVNILSESFFINDSINLESDLINDLNLDSLDMLDLVFQIEQEFKIAINNETDFKTINNVVDFIVASTVEAKDNKFLKKGETNEFK